jgi:hypothetical protein
MSKIKIISGKLGWHLMVDGLYISYDFGCTPRPIKAIMCNNGIPYGATQWVSIESLKKFWHDYMPMISSCTVRPYTSAWGELLPITLPSHESVPELAEYITNNFVRGSKAYELSKVFLNELNDLFSEEKDVNNVPEESIDAIEHKYMNELIKLF